MKSTESRVSALEQSIGLHIWSPDVVACGVRGPDGFVCGYHRIRTGENVNQRDDESDAEFVMRAAATGFGLNTNLEAGDLK